jgi:hypothetical protein
MPDRNFGYPLDCYWIRPGGVFSSKTQTVVAVNNAIYLAWVAAGGYTRPDPGDAALRELLAPYGLGITVAETAKLALLHQLAQKPYLLAKILKRFGKIVDDLLLVLATPGAISAANRNALRTRLQALLETNEQTDPDS